MGIEDTNVGSKGRLHRGLPFPMQLNALNKESPHERKLSARGPNQNLSQKSKFPLLKNRRIHTGEAEAILAALSGGGLTRRKVSESLHPFMHTDRNVGKPGIKYKVGINGINRGQGRECKASGGEKTQGPGVETSLDVSDFLKVVTRGRKKGEWQYKKKAGHTLIDLTNVKVRLQRFADATTSKVETIGLPPGEETQDFPKIDKLDRRDDRMPLNPEAAILEESIRKRLAVKSTTEQLMQKQRALLAAAKTLIEDKMLDNGTMREFLNHVDSSDGFHSILSSLDTRDRHTCHPLNMEAEAHLLAIGQPDGEPSVIFKSETITYDKGLIKRRGYFGDTSDGDGGAEMVPGGSVISTGYKPSSARSEWSGSKPLSARSGWSFGYKPSSARSGWSLGYKPSSARSGYFSEANPAATATVFKSTKL